MSGILHSFIQAPSMVWALQQSPTPAHTQTHTHTHTYTSKHRYIKMHVQATHGRSVVSDGLHHLLDTLILPNTTHAGDDMHIKYMECNTTWQVFRFYFCAWISIDKCANSFNILHNIFRGIEFHGDLVYFVKCIKKIETSIVLRLHAFIISYHQGNSRDIGWMPVPGVPIDD